jgi:periplasmic copper chaperone A
LRVRLLEAAAAVALLFPACASAGPVQVIGAWIRALPAGLPAAGYFTLHNTSSKEVELARASSAACGMLMLHKSEEQGGMGSMQDVTSVAVPAGGTVKFAPGGYHLMCMNPTAAIKPGGNVSVTLDFSDGSQVAALFAVRNAQGK